MSIYLYFLIALICSAIATRILMPWLLRLCHKKNLYDQPGERKVHHHRIPRLGGVVFIPTTALSLTCVLSLLVSNNDITETFHISTLIVGMGMLIIYLIGVLDDLFGLSANLKFLVQFMAALCFPICGLYFNNLYGFCGIWEVNPLLGQAVTVILVMFVVNSINTIDGIDGLCAGLSCICLLIYTYYFHAIGNNIFCFFTGAMLGTLLVFLKYNLFGNAAKGNKTFMGDSGSLILGFSFCYLGLKLSMTNNYIAPPAEGILIPYTVLIIPTFDLVRVAFNRILQGRHPFSPDKTHIHHILLSTGMNQHKALLVLLTADVFLIILNFGLWNAAVNVTWIVFLDILLFTLFVKSLRRKTPLEPAPKPATIPHKKSKKSSKHSSR